MTRPRVGASRSLGARGTRRAPETHRERHARVDPQAAHVVDKRIDDVPGGALGGALWFGELADAVARALRGPAHEAAEALGERVGGVGRAVQLVVGDLRMRDRCDRSPSLRISFAPNGDCREAQPEKERKRTLEPTADTAPPPRAPPRATPPHALPARPARAAPRRPGRPWPGARAEGNVLDLHGRLVRVERGVRGRGGRVRGRLAGGRGRRVGRGRVCYPRRLFGVHHGERDQPLSDSRREVLAKAQAPRNAPLRCADSACSPTQHVLPGPWHAASAD